MQKQYGVIPYFYENGKLKVVLITSASGNWIFPKGRFEKKLGKGGTAEQEALEEAGVEGTVFRGSYYRTRVYIKSGEQVHLTLYAMQVETIHDVWEEDYRRKRKFVSPKSALKMISQEGLAKCLQKLERDLVEHSS